MRLCDVSRLPELIISDKIDYTKKRSFYSNRAFSYGEDAITLRAFTKYRTKFEFEKFLKRLHFRGDYFNNYLHVNDFTQLEELTINFHPDSFGFDSGSKHYYINLPNLKILDISGCDTVHFHIKLTYVLNTPKLEKLKCCCFSSVSLADAENIDHFEAFYDSRQLSLTQSLRNVQYFKIEYNMLSNDDALLDFPKLTTLVCNEFSTYRIYNALSMARHYVNGKQFLTNRPEVRIYYQSVEVVDSIKIDESNSANSILEFQMNNYDALCDNVSCGGRPLDYNELMGLVKGNLPDDFFIKFRDFRTVEVSGEVNQEHLLQFLKRMEYFVKLQLNAAILDQSFFDGLQEMSQLTEVHMRNSLTLRVNYDFLLTLKHLEIFRTDRDSLEFFDLSLALFKQLKYFREIEFVYGNDRISVCREFSNRYSLRRFVLADQYSYVDKTGFNFEQLRDEFEFCK